jgi:hypothetical protein
MKHWLILTIVISFSTIAITSTAQTPEVLRSPQNQVFQFMQSGTCTQWSDSSKTNATLYLWIPEQCVKLKGLLIMCTNVPEQMLVGHPAIRKVCAENNLGIIWSTPSFMNFRKTVKDGKTLNMALEYGTNVAFLQSLLNGLATTSGYEEVATVPWLPMGESGHLLMVDALMEHSPERCIAGIFIKNNHLPPHNRVTPTLTIYGSSQEWGQDKVDMRLRWNGIDKDYQSILTQRQLNPNWPLSYVIDGTSGHFDCSEKIVQYMATYIDAVTKARVTDNNSLKPLVLTDGFLADLPVPGHENKPIKKFNAADTAYISSPWYLNTTLAQQAQNIAHINWKAATQLPAFQLADGTIAPFIFNGISKVIPTQTEDDGITFTVKGIMLAQMPDSFITAKQPLPAVKEAPVTEWVSGQFKPLGNNRFQIMLDRSWPNTANYLGVRQKGNDSLRPIFQPGGLTLPRNTQGKPQKITFNSIADVKAGKKSIELAATSDAGLPVQYYVVAGPAIIENNQLVFTKIPPRAKYPLAVTVAAWQWGNAKLGIKMAEIVKQTFYIKQ